MPSAASQRQRPTEVYREIVDGCRDASIVLRALAERGVPEQHRPVLARMEAAIAEAKLFMEEMGSERCPDPNKALALRDLVSEVALEAASIWKQLPDD